MMVSELSISVLEGKMSECCSSRGGGKLNKMMQEEIFSDGRKCK